MVCRDCILSVFTRLHQPPPHPHSDYPPARSAYFAKIRLKKGSLPQILRSFKAVVTKRVRALELLEPQQPLWQSRYYDRVVRDEREKKRIIHHLKSEVQEWTKDDYYQETPSTCSSHSDKDKGLNLPHQSLLLKHNTYQSPLEWNRMCIQWRVRWLFYVERGMIDGVLQRLKRWR